MQVVLGNIPCECTFTSGLQCDMSHTGFKRDFPLLENISISLFHFTVDSNNGYNKQE